MYSETIKRLFMKMPIIPKELLVLFLMKRFNISRSLAENAVFAACRDRICYVKTDTDILVKRPSLEPDSSSEAVAKAFALALEFLPESENFTIARAPATISFIRGNKYVLIYNMPAGNELGMSMMVADDYIEPEDRDSMRRLLIVDENCDLSLIKKAGFSFICMVDKNYKVTILEKIPQSEAWNDVKKRK